MRWWWLLLLCWSGWVWAGELIDPPALPTEPVNERAYLRKVAENWNNLAHYTTGNPNGVRRGKPGDLIWATFGGGDNVCLNTGAGPGLTTTWKCHTF